MKTIKYTIAALALATFSFGSFATDLVTSVPVD